MSKFKLFGKLFLVFFSVWKFVMQGGWGVSRKSKLLEELVCLSMDFF